MRPRAGTMIVLGALLAATGAGALDHAHTMSPSYHAAIIGAESRSTYNFHSPGISYATVVGDRVGLRARLALFFPVHLFQDGRYFHAKEIYATAVGGEALLGAAFVFRLPEGQSVIADVGPSAIGVKLGSNLYETFYSFTIGLGAGLEYAYPVNRALVVGVTLNAAGHFADVIHEGNGLKYGVFISAGMTLGLRFAARKGSS